MSQPSAERVAEELRRRLVDRRWGLAVAAVHEGETEVRVMPGRDVLTEQSCFEWGSITKTVTGVLLAESVVRRELSLDTTVGELLTGAGGTASVTLRELATHTSGLPRLPPDLEVTDRARPYQGYGVEDLQASLAGLDLAERGTHRYSNYGFMLLGHLLEVATGSSYAELLSSRVLGPLDMTGSGAPAPQDHRLPGYDDAGAPTPWWDDRLCAAGGVGGPITDLARWVEATIEPETTPLAEAIALATSEQLADPVQGLGWAFMGGGWWHNGGTGGFRAFVAVFRPTRSGVALLANGAQAEQVDNIGFGVLTDVARGQTSHW